MSGKRKALECFAATGAVFFDDGPQVWVAVESGSSEASACGDFVKGDRQVVENDCGAGVFDMLSAVGGHPVWA